MDKPEPPAGDEPEQEQPAGTAEAIQDEDSDNELVTDSTSHEREVSAEPTNVTNNDHTKADKNIPQAGCKTNESSGSTMDVWNKMTVSQLRAECKRHQLPTSGRKVDILQRLELFQESMEVNSE